MSSIEEEIIKWSNKRHDWVRSLIADIVKGTEISDDKINTLAQSIISETQTATTELALTDLPTSSSTGAKIQLVSISDLEGINALLKEQTLSFGQNGVTAIYGDNGTGKSGYARLIKDMVGARNKESVLTNAYDEGVAVQQSAMVTWSKDAVDIISNWQGVEDLILRQVHFYDEACGNDYIVSESELSYRPSVLNFLDNLILAIDRVRDRFDDLIRLNYESRKQLPILNSDTKPHEFLSTLSEKTSKAAIDEATRLPEGFQETLAAAIAEEARLKATNPINEKSRLIKAVDSLKSLANHLDDLELLIGFNASKAILKLRDSAIDYRKTADTASKQDFVSEPLEGIGSETWRLLWSAAEEYSKVVAYPETDFPAIDDGSRCVLCQQLLESDSADRLKRFHHFVHDKTAKDAKEAELKYEEAINKIVEMHVTTTDVTAGLTFLETENGTLAKVLKFKLVVAQNAKDLLGKRLRDESKDEFINLNITESKQLRILAGSVKLRAEKINAADFLAKLKIATSNKFELEDLNQLSANKIVIEAEVQRLKDLAILSNLKMSVNTGFVTKFSTALSRKYVTTTVTDRFACESENLKLSHVVLGDKGGDKGRLRHKPTLLGVTNGSLPVQVLSEGEQTALGLAGLFTEIYFDSTKSAVVLDDPVSSLDHDRRGIVAKRIVELAKDRQVIVMTHDLTFLGQIVKETDAQNVSLTERCIERTRKAEPGFVREGYPWKANNAKKRFRELELELARIKKEQDGYENDKYEKETSEWAGKLSETWERIVRSEIAYKIVDRGSSEVKPKMFRILAKITETDNREFQDSYNKISGWVRRHDKSEEENFTPPDINQMDTELDRARTWYRRIQQY